MAKNDFWGFKDERELERQIVDIPETVLKEQMDLLSEKTGYMIYAIPSVLVIRNADIDYKMATKIELMVPALDKYTKTLMIMYSNPTSAYPVALSVGKSYEDDMDLFAPDYTCDNSESFTEALKKILSSKRNLESSGHSSFEGKVDSF